MNIIKDWDYFWDNRSLFHLGHLPTETSNPNTTGLAELAQNDLASAVQKLLDVDHEALTKLLAYVDDCAPLKAQINEVLTHGGRIFISGCGATGRLAMMLEKLWRLQAPESMSDRVIGFIAGGDAALIKSIEGFEDHTEYAEQQIQMLGFTQNDLMIGVTEGGETPFVLGTVEYALQHSKHHPWLLYCNPDETLANVERSNQLIQSPNVHNLCLYVGNMALTGSTRMQATTVQTLALGYALFDFIQPCDARAQIKKLKKVLQNIDVHLLSALIHDEATIYKNNGLVTYQTTADLGLTVLTDTTERSPTFSTYAFENSNDDIVMASLCFLSIADAKDPETTWQNILGHPPRTLEWDFSKKDTGIERLMGFDISENAFSRRKSMFLANVHSLFQIAHDNDHLYFSNHAHQLEINTSGLSVLSTQVLLKCILNLHSTLVMALLGKFQSNIMTHVFPSNNKLIDRATRYVLYLLEQQGVTCEYDKVAQTLYNAGENMHSTESIVLKTLAKLTEKA